MLRFLSDKSRELHLKDLGFEGEDLQAFEETIKKPWGMILVTGPTGSGKTTTLYAALKELNKREINISTIEDPVEYDIDGINQIQVNTKTNLTFAQGLRALVRQDPDVIMVGEIRDKETADIAVNAAMTGHLVFSTLHTNDASTAFPRLLDMEVEDFLISSTVLAVLAQRLVRKICLTCIESYIPDAKRLQFLEQMPSVKAALLKDAGKETLEGIRLFRGKGCPTCHNSGYRGRVGIFEILEVTDGVRTQIMKQENADIIRQGAISAGMRTMLQDGIKKILIGRTTLEEVLRVTKE